MHNTILWRGHGSVPTGRSTNAYKEYVHMSAKRIVVIGGSQRAKGCGQGQAHGRARRVIVLRKIPTSPWHLAGSPTTWAAFRRPEHAPEHANRSNPQPAVLPQRQGHRCEDQYRVTAIDRRTGPSASRICSPETRVNWTTTVSSSPPVRFPDAAGVRH